MNPKKSVGAVVLTGGGSSRMGRDKSHLIHHGDVGFAQYVAGVLSGVADRVIEVGNGSSGLDSCIEDSLMEGPARGAMRGFASLMGSEGIEAIVVTACDLPYLERQTLEMLLEQRGRGSLVPVCSGFPQYLCSVLSRDAVAALLRNSLPTQLSMGELFRRADDLRYLAVDSAKLCHSFSDCDDPASYTRFLQWMREEGSMRFRTGIVGHT